MEYFVSLFEVFIFILIGICSHVFAFLNPGAIGFFKKMDIGLDINDFLGMFSLFFSICEFCVCVCMRICMFMCMCTCKCKIIYISLDYAFGNLFLFNFSVLAAIGAIFSATDSVCTLQVKKILLCCCLTLCKQYQCQLK